MPRIDRSSNEPKSIARNRFDIPGMDSIRIPKRFAQALLTFLALYGAACLVLFLKQRDILYHPMPPQSLAANASWSQYKEGRYWLTAPSAQAHGSSCEGKKGQPDGAVAYFGGNAEAASLFGQHAADLPGCAIYALNYPGYEGAPGRPSQESIDAAADSMMDAIVRDGHPRSTIIVIGRSLGSGEAVRQASLGPCRLAVLLTPYDSMASVAADHFPWLPAGALTLDKFPADQWAGQAHCDASIFYVDHDDVIPYDHAFALAHAWSPNFHASLSSNSRATHANIGDRASTWAYARGEIASH